MKKSIKFISLLLLITIIIQTFDLGSLSLFGQITAKAKIELDAPEELKCIYRTDQSITLSWKAPEKTDDIEGYKIYFGNKCIKTISKNKSNCVLNSLVPNNLYSLYIRAYGNDGETSEASKIINVKTLIKIPNYDFTKENNIESTKDNSELDNLEEQDLNEANLDESNLILENAYETAAVDNYTTTQEAINNEIPKDNFEVKEAIPIVDSKATENNKEVKNEVIYEKIEQFMEGTEFEK